MERPVPVIFDFTIILVTGAAAALLVRRVGIPTIVGYLLAGAVIGPYGLGLVRETQTLVLLAGVGVALLMFALGVELSLSQLSAAARAAWIAAPLQITLSILAGMALAAAIGWTPAEGILLGFLVSLSSTMLVVKMLTDSGRLSTLHGQALVAISLVQDLAAVVMVAFIPLLRTGGGEAQIPALALVLAKAVGFVFIIWLLARFVVPPMMAMIAGTFSREIFLAAVTALALAGAVATEALGFSLALGAFLAGLALSESPYNHEVLAEVLPLRDIFGILFFVTLGTLLNLELVAARLPLVMAIAGLVLIGKPLLTLLAMRAAGYHLTVALPTAAALGQMGEFSFVIVTIAVTQGLASSDYYALVVAAASVTILLSPLLYSASPRLASALGRWGRPRTLPVRVMPALYAHFIIMGYGRVGRNIGEAVRAFDIPLVVVDLNPEVIAELQRQGVTAVYGDAGSPALLDQAMPQRAQAAAVALPDAHSSVLAVRGLRHANPRLHLVARAHTAQEIDMLYAAGADHVVQAEFEASLEMVRQSLIHLGQPLGRVQDLVDRMRAARYGPLTEEGEYPPPGQVT